MPIQEKLQGCKSAALQLFCARSKFYIASFNSTLCNLKLNTGYAVKKFRSLLLLVAIGCSNSYAYSVVTVFGLPLGGNLNYQPKLCSQSSSNAREVCWINKPRIQDNVQTGMIRMPNSDVFPKWAEFAKFEMHYSESGGLEALFVYGGDIFDAPKIEQSISSRFGLPTRKRLRQPGDITQPSLIKNSYHADWELPNIEIGVECLEADSCTTRFTSERRIKERARSASELRKIDLARPVAP